MIFCGEQYETIYEAFGCEAACLGLTFEEYKEYKTLLADEEDAYRMTASANNMKIRMSCDEASKSVVDFEREHGLLDKYIRTKG